MNARILFAAAGLALGLQPSFARASDPMSNYLVCLSALYVESARLDMPTKEAVARSIVACGKFRTELQAAIDKRSAGRGNAMVVAIDRKFYNEIANTAVAEPEKPATGK